MPCKQVTWRFWVGTMKAKGGSFDTYQWWGPSLVSGPLLPPLTAFMWATVMSKGPRAAVREPLTDNPQKLCLSLGSVRVGVPHMHIYICGQYMYMYTYVCVYIYIYTPCTHISIYHYLSIYLSLYLSIYLIEPNPI